MTATHASRTWSSWWSFTSWTVACCPANSNTTAPGSPCEPGATKDPCLDEHSLCMCALNNTNRQNNQIQIRLCLYCWVSDEFWLFLCKSTCAPFKLCLSQRIQVYFIKQMMVFLIERLRKCHCVSQKEKLHVEGLHWYVPRLKLLLKNNSSYIYFSI